MNAPKIRKDFQKAYDLAVARGWKRTSQSQGLVLLSHPLSFHRIRVPMADNSSASYSSKAVMERVLSVGPVAAAQAPGPSRAKDRSTERPHLRAVPPPAAAEARRAPEETSRLAPVQGAPAGIASLKPYVSPSAQKAGGKSPKPSHAVLERTRTDGSVDYVCAARDCSVASASARSTAIHFGKSHERGDSVVDTSKPVAAVVPSAPVAEAPAEQVQEPEPPAPVQLRPPVAPVPPLPREEEKRPPAAEPEAEAPAPTEEGAQAPQGQAPAGQGSPVWPTSAEGRLAVVRAMLFPSDEDAARIAELHSAVAERDAVIAELHRTIGRLAGITGAPVQGAED